MLTNTEILSWASLNNYAQLNISPTCVIRPGRERWEKRLPMLTEDERAALVTKINRQQTRLQRELATRYGSNASPQSVQRLAKEDSMPVPRHPDRPARSTTTGRRPAARRSDGRR